MNTRAIDFSMSSLKAIGLVTSSWLALKDTPCTTQATWTIFSFLQQKTCDTLIDPQRRVRIVC